MMTNEENNLLSQTGPSSPCGNLMRRYWQPVALSQELPDSDSPLPVRILGEDLVLFRNDDGEVGLLGLHCAHRGADLSYGRIEDGGLRCIYHGWLYSIHGRCLDQPGEPNGGNNRESIRQTSYPCVEKGGAIFAYLGPGDPPLLPNYNFIAVPAEQRFVTKIFQDCNYLQGNEGNLDPVHTSFLHRKLEDDGKSVRGTGITYNNLQASDTTPVLDVELTDFGFRIYAVRRGDTDTYYLKVTNFVFPNLSAVNADAGRRGEGYLVNWHVPIDDTSHWKYVFIFNSKHPLPPERIQSMAGRSEMTPGYRLTRNRENRYLQDRQSMMNESFNGLGLNFQAHDIVATESAGPIQDRTQEHLVTSDMAVIAARKLLMNAIKDVQEGRDPLHVIRDSKKNHFDHLVAMTEVIPAAKDWKDHLREKLESSSMFV